jgi:hypothetical protein
MSMIANKSILTTATRELAAQWGQTRNDWRDAKCVEFEKRYIHELLASVDTAAEVIDRLDKLVIRIRSDCE